MTEVGLLTDYNAANLAKRGGNETLKGFGELRTLFPTFTCEHIQTSSEQILRGP